MLSGCSAPSVEGTVHSQMPDTVRGAMEGANVTLAYMVRLESPRKTSRGTGNPDLASRHTLPNLTSARATAIGRERIAYVQEHLTGKTDGDATVRRL